MSNFMDLSSNTYENCKGNMLIYKGYDMIWAVMDFHGSFPDITSFITSHPKLRPNSTRL